MKYYIINMLTYSAWWASAGEARLYAAFALRHEMPYLVTTGPDSAMMISPDEIA